MRSRLSLASFSIITLVYLCPSAIAWAQSGAAKAKANSRASLIPALAASLPEAAAKIATTPPPTIVIPGPLRSFMRMAAISQKASPEEVLPLLSRNVVVDGFRDVSERSGKATDYLILLKRYLQQARELRTVAGA